MKKSRISALCGLLLVFVVAITGMSFRSFEKSNRCPTNTLSSPPATYKVYSGTCSTGTPCARANSTLLTLTNPGSCSHTWTFTNNTTGCVKVFNTGAGVGTLQTSIPGSTGDSISLVVTDDGGGTGPTYGFTGSGC